MKPNISPGKHSNESQNNDDETSDKKPAEKPAAPKKEEPKLNILQVKASKIFLNRDYYKFCHHDGRGS